MRGVLILKNDINFGEGSIPKLLMKLAPPVMAAQLIQALYNIVDSYFIGKYSESGLTALSIIYPLQLLMIALAVGTGVGLNTLIALLRGTKEYDESRKATGTAAPVALVMWALFAAVCFFLMPLYAAVSTDSEIVRQEVITYGRIVSVFSIGLFLESMWTKVLQAGGNMKLPMIAQIAGAAVNIILDPILIFSFEMGIAGAAIATVAGQIAAALIVMPKAFCKSPAFSEYPHLVKRIYYLGFPNILMQSAYTFYILMFNLILKSFSDQAVTALGLYYKWQSFFFIPLGAMQTCIVPLISFNHGAGKYDRCRKTMSTAILMGMALMALGVLCFELVPSQMIQVFSHDSDVIAIGTHGFRLIGLSFIPMVTSLIFPVFFQAVGNSGKSSFLTVLRTVILFVPLGFLFARFGGLEYFWAVFPVTEIITSSAGYIMYKQKHL
ncbi:MAG TPA: MATE family efflux transporter [Ruminococcus sp.]|nr:MATE family efflux transporter [Ruminococcus sp.]HCR73981.1 MATE family efflux transporter [Ruminococcus sp.]